MVKEQYRDTLEEGGSTYQITGKLTPPCKYYAIGLWGEQYSAAKFRETDLLDFWQRYQGVLSEQPNLAVGTWYDEDEGTYAVDLVLLYPRRSDLALGHALIIAAAFQQKAIFDLNTQREIKLGL